MKITLVNQTEKNKFTISEKKLNRLVDSICNELKAKKIKNKIILNKNELTCVFLTKKEMQILNTNFRNKKKPTDVLSFQPVEVHSVGELVFCPDVLVIQAKKQKHSLSDEFMYMLIHGLLHLLGYDHEISAKAEKLMFNLQDSVFDQLTQHQLNLDCIRLKK